MIDFSFIIFLNIINLCSKIISWRNTPEKKQVLFDNFFFPLFFSSMIIFQFVEDPFVYEVHMWKFASLYWGAKASGIPSSWFAQHLHFNLIKEFYQIS